ncbi:unnamed protein product [Scytosiphon promiscuus]
MGDAAGNGEVKAGDQATKQQPEAGYSKDAAAAQLSAPDSREAAAAVGEAPPVLVFLNSASGGKMGPKVKEKIGVLIPESRLFDLQEVKEGKWKPEDKLKLFQDTKNVKVLICGGDGTMGWILSCIDRLRMVSEPSPLDSTPSVLGEEAFPVAMMPLGTGNDLARTFGWGPGFTRNMLKPSFLDKVEEAPPARLDRWLLSVMPYEPLLDDAEVKKSKIPPTFSLHRYASLIGNSIAGREDLGPLVDSSEHSRTQSVVRMGRSFSVRMSSQAKLVHEDEMNRSSSQGSRSLTGSRHGRREGTFSGSFGGEFKTEETVADSETSSVSAAAGDSGSGEGSSSMVRASSAPPALRYSAGGGSSLGLVAMPTVGEIVDSTGREEAASSVGSSVSSPVDTGAGEKAGGTERKGGGSAGAGAKTEAGEGEGVAVGGAPVSEVVVAASGGDGQETTAAAGADPSKEPMPQQGEQHRLGEEKVEEIRRAATGVVVRDAVAAAAAAGGEEKGEGGGGFGVKREVAVQTEKAQRRMGPPPRAMPSISVMQKFETWESYDAVFCNYFSFGVDAVAASAFHRHRENHPHLFTSRLRNQLWYARKGFPEAGGYPCGSTPPPPPVSDYVELRVKATPEAEWETVGLDSTLRGIVVLNLQSYGGGRNLWGTAEAGCSQRQYAKAAPDDGLLEIVGITNIFKLGCIMGFNKVGARAHRVSQAAEVEIRIRSKIHMQIDGEPWLQDKAKINIQHYGRSTCLRGRR